MHKYLLVQFPHKLNGLPLKDLNHQRLQDTNDLHIKSGVEITTLVLLKKLNNQVNP